MVIMHYNAMQHSSLISRPRIIEMCVQETAAEGHYHYHRVTTTSTLESNISQLSSRRASQLPTNTQYWEPVSVTAAAERRIETHRNHRSS